MSTETEKAVELGANLIDNVARGDSGAVVSLLLLFLVILSVVIVYLYKRIRELDDVREEANKLALEAHNRIVDMQSNMLNSYHSDRMEIVTALNEVNRTLDTLVRGGR